MQDALGLKKMTAFMADNDLESGTDGESNSRDKRIPKANAVDVFGAPADHEFPAGFVPARKRSRTEAPTCAVGLIFAGAAARLVTGDGSIKLRINQRPNHPGLICSTGESGLPLTATEMGGR
jgi:hypothetical protein